MSITLHPVERDNVKIGSFHDNVDILIKGGEKTNNYFSYINGYSLIRYFNKLIKFKNKSILDYGCGPGHFINLILKNYKPKSITRIDLSYESINECNSLNHESRRFKDAITYGLNGEVKFNDCSFDIILLIQVVEHLDNDNLEKIFTQIKRLLKPNGVLLISTPNDEVLEDSIQICPDCGCYFYQVQHVRTWSSSSLSKFVMKFGFTKVKTYETSLLSVKTFIKRILTKIYNIICKILKIKANNLILYCKK